MAKNVKNNIPIPFRVGDVVKVVQKQQVGYCCESGPIYEGKIGQKHIIMEISWNGATWEYVTNHGAWYDHEMFVLLEEANEKSLKKATKFFEEDH
jgi:hypothetical protein